MRQRDAFKRWWGGAAIGVLTLLILAAGLCCLEQEVMDHHGVPVDLCSMAILISVASLTVGALLLLGLTPTLGRPLLATIHLAVPKPPPRHIRLS